VQDPLFSSNADAFHSTCVRHGPTLEKCRFEWMDDDGIAIQGAYAVIAEASGNRVMADCRDSTCLPGDTLRIYDDKRAFVAECKIADIKERPDYRLQMPIPGSPSHFKDQQNSHYCELSLDQEIQAQPGWMFNNANATGGGFTIRDCVIRGNRARGMMMKASDGTIEGCTVERSTQGGIVFFPEFSGTWNESDFGHNVVIRNNVIRDVHHRHGPIDPRCGALVVAAFEKGQYVPLPGGHRNITIENNTFEDNVGINVLVTSAEGVEIKGNHFVRIQS
jgi:hypothetical protein